VTREAVAALAHAVLPASQQAYDEAVRRQGLLAKPPGSLGRLEALSAQLAGISGSCPPPVATRPALLVAAGDHGVHAQGVSAWPQALSTAIAAGCVNGTSVAAVLARDAGVRLVLLDVGLCAPLPPCPDVRDRRMAAGTQDLSVQDAMTPDQVAQAVLAGADVAGELLAEGADLLLLGEVGIANTTAAACLVGQLTGSTAEAVTGRGAGADDVGLQRKREVVSTALARTAGRSDGLDVLAALGGFEHAALVGALLRAAGARVPVVLDGVSAVAAALCGVQLAPHARDHLVASHRSAEPASGVGLAHLGLSPLLELDLRLGEGSGALLALPLVRAAAVVLRDTGLITGLGEQLT
jgi:nicotinate-nucleotide--dimethylbenzimidazole phosphoribosyltransferase